MRTSLKVPTLLLALALAGPAAADTTSTVYPTKDAMIFGTSTGSYIDNASGMGPGMFAGADSASRRKRGLVTFNLSNASPSIPSNATIDSVTLTMVSGQTAGYAGSGCEEDCTYEERTIRIYRLTNSWVEGTTGSPTSTSMGGTGQGWTITSGDVSWKYRNYSGSLWTSLGTDYNSTELASNTFGPVFPLGLVCTWSSAGLVGEVQAWQANSSYLLDWLIKSDLETSSQSFLGFWTIDGAAANSNTALKPKLEVVWH